MSRTILRWSSRSVYYATSSPLVRPRCAISRCWACGAWRSWRARTRTNCTSGCAGLPASGMTSAAWMFSRRRWRRRAIPICVRSSVNGGIGAANGRHAVRRARPSALTTPDLVLLSLLAEGPLHGYQANLELERRDIRDWAGISRPQVYYSLEKLARLGLIRSQDTDAPAAGLVFKDTATT